MSITRRGYYWLLLLPFLALVGLGVYWAYSRSRAWAFEAAPFTPDGAAVDALRAAAKNANLVICVIDAARADHLGCYGYPRETTPSIDALARQSLKLDQHFCQYPKTRPSAASLFTGQYSDTHLVRDDRAFLPKTFTMAKGLQRAGFHTALFSSNPNSSPGMGIGLDFEEAYDQTQVKPLVKHWEELTRPEPLLTLFRSWLQKHRRSRFFAYVHIDPPHQPYIQPDELTALFKGKTPPNFQRGEFRFPVGDKKTLLPYPHAPLLEWINLYDANLRYADSAVGDLERVLKDAGVYQDTLFVFTADHGEAFGEHGYLWHERGVYDEVVHIPLIIRWPGGSVRPRVVNALTETVDLLPTVFDAFKIRYPKDAVQGRSLLPVIAGTADSAHDYVFSRADGDPPTYLVRSLEYALVLYGNGEWRALYDLAKDPGQRHDIYAAQPGQAKQLLEAFRRFAQTQRRAPLEFLDPNARPQPLPDAPKAQLSPEVKRQLRGLGYVK